MGSRRGPSAPAQSRSEREGSDVAWDNARNHFQRDHGGAVRPWRRRTGSRSRPGPARGHPAHHERRRGGDWPRRLRRRPEPPGRPHRYDRLPAAGHEPRRQRRRLQPVLAGRRPRHEAHGLRAGLRGRRQAALPGRPQACRRRPRLRPVVGHDDALHDAACGRRQGRPGHRRRHPDAGRHRPGGADVDRARHRDGEPGGDGRDGRQVRRLLHGRACGTATARRSWKPPAAAG